ncbi:MAG: class I SAM-dependent methyltransferase, partial [Candidatus Accumulibacter sp.]|nr:class I SAM-dependent methyltransferase [Accumulibacter sp.]
MIAHAGNPGFMHLSANDPAGVSVVALSPEHEEVARDWAQRLGLPFGRSESHHQLWVGPDGLWFASTATDAPGPIRADFVGGTAAHRRRFGGGQGQMIARAVGIRAGMRPLVL